MSDPQGPLMVLVKGGSYFMGCQEEVENSLCAPLELPLHKVYVDDFYIGAYELSMEEFSWFIDATGYQTEADIDGESYIAKRYNYIMMPGVNWKCDGKGVQRPEPMYELYPVGHISYNDVLAYCEWLSKETGKHYRMPTEAEWEYAARGGEKSLGYRYSGSNKAKDVAWTINDIQSDLSPRGLRKPNELGLYDMSGNTWEWCSDYRDYYNVLDSINPKGPATGEVRVVRGGCVTEKPYRCCVWSRGSCFQSMRRDKYGVRIACDVTTK